MKKILFFVSALAGLFFAASCQQEEFAPVEESNVVTFEVGIPEVATKAYADDGTNIDDLVYAVYRTDQDNLADALSENDLHPVYQKNFPKVVFNNGSTTIPIELINNQNYLIVFWAQVDDAWVKGTDFNLFEVKYPTEMDANNQKLEAFSGTSFITNVTGGRNEKVTLKRPFAQINLATKLPQTFEATISKSSMAVVGAPVSFNAIEQIASTDVTTTAEPLNFKNAVIPGGDFKEGYAYAGANYIFAGEKNTVTVSYTITTSHGVVNNSVPSVPVAKNYRTNIIGNLLTSTADYNVEIEAGFTGSVDRDPYTTYVTNDEELTAALAQNIKDIVIDLAQVETKASTPKTYNINVGANTPTYYFGGEETRTITIKANGNTVNFVHKNTDWNYIRCVSEDAKWIINDANLTNSGANDGPWNRHDIRFYNAVELNNVTSDKAIALLNDGKFNNVTITEDTGVYGLWIVANGQKVDINGLNITATNGGRGIAIKDEYVDVPACVTLNVENATFETAEKAAILVTSTKGAVITLKDVDITKVAKDSDFAVWVDEDYVADADKVVVNGGLCKVEGASASLADNLEELKQGLSTEGATVYLQPTKDGKSLELGGKISIAKGASLIGIGDEPVGVDNDWGSTTFPEQAHFTNTHIENIFFDDNMVIDAGIANGIVTFKNCVFGGHLAHQGVHFDSGNGVVIFDNCTFVGRNMLGSSLEKVVFNNCTFLNKKSSLTGADKWTGVNMWGKYEFNNCVFDTEAHCNVKCDGVEAAFNDCSFVDERDVASVINNSKDFEANITFDGKTYVAEGLFLEGQVYTVHSGNGFKYAATEVLNDGTKNVTIELANDIDLTGIEWPAVKTAAAFVLDGKGHSIKNLTTSAVEDHGFYSTAMFTSTRKATTIKNLVVEDATITGKGGDNSHGAVLVACNYAALNIEGVTVKNSTVSNCDRSSALVTYLYFTTATVKNCVVEGCEVNSIGTAGALLGMNNSHDFEATGNTVKNTTISSSEGSNKAGILIGTWQKAGTLTETDNVVENSKAINAGVETNNNIGRKA